MSDPAITPGTPADHEAFWADWEPPVFAPMPAGAPGPPEAIEDLPGGGAK